jgi:hypothetical protein
MTLCLMYHNIEEYDALLIKLSHYSGMWRSVNEDIIVLRNMTLCWWTDHTLAEYNALLIKVSQDWGMWRSFDEEITVLQNMSLCFRFHNIEECDALLFKLSRFWVDEDI